MDGQYPTKIPRERLPEALVDGLIANVDGIEVPLRHQYAGDVTITSGDVITWDPHRLPHNRLRIWVV